MYSVTWGRALEFEAEHRGERRTRVFRHKPSNLFCAGHSVTANCKFYRPLVSNTLARRKITAHSR